MGGPPAGRQPDPRGGTRLVGRWRVLARRAGGKQSSCLQARLIDRISHPVPIEGAKERASCAGSPHIGGIEEKSTHAESGCPLPPRLLVGVIRVSRRPTAADRASCWQTGGGEELAVGPRAVANTQDRCGTAYQRWTVTRRATADRPPNGAAVVCGAQRVVRPRPSPPPSPPHSNGCGGGLLSRPFANRRRPGGMAFVSRHPRGPCWGGAWRPRARPAACPDLALGAGGTTAIWPWREWGERGVGAAAVARLVGGARGRW